MFSKGDPSDVQKRIQIALTTRSGETETGSILIAAHCSLRQALNDDGPFIEIETADGRRSFLLKREIARIDPVGSEPRQQRPFSDDWSRFDAKDARVVLGVGFEATQQELHSAWRELARLITQIGWLRSDCPRKCFATRIESWRGSTQRISVSRTRPVRSLPKRPPRDETGCG